ncbi:shikimate dehydrogenase [Bradyrhizobium genosp. L]|uniref:shikimate dehydrogenase n=1 Tax=Bradyrhizobium genosp. L TaxID=83637 RepID=UPI0018A331D7|nr:shikimate dehydrogenase [Bradyrhizobium genosp. L]QPF82000.1 shikimate dehydrogenase [Bradyrhizobium genosp. L]
MSDKYAVVGNPIDHTKSPLIHLSFAKETGQTIDYIAIEAPVGGFSDVVDRFRREGGVGLNITAPFKMDAFAYCTVLKERARLAGAVNAMKFEADRVTGENFDGIGLTNDITRNLGCLMQGRRVALLGAGGAARGVVLPFLEQGPAELVIANRTVTKAEELGRKFERYGPVTAIGYSALADKKLGRFDLVVNATSASLLGELPPISPEAFGDDCLAYELLYGKGLTPFLRLARNAGVKRLADGVGMLVEQAAEAFVWWRGLRPDTRTTIKRLTVPLE